MKITCVIKPDLKTPQILFHTWKGWKLVTTCLTVIRRRHICTSAKWWLLLDFYDFSFLSQNTAASDRLRVSFTSVCWQSCHSLLAFTFSHCESHYITSSYKDNKRPCGPQKHPQPGSVISSSLLSHQPRKRHWKRFPELSPHSLSCKSIKLSTATSHLRIIELVLLSILVEAVTSQTNVVGEASVQVQFAFWGECYAGGKQVSLITSDRFQQEQTHFTTFF